MAISNLVHCKNIQNKWVDKRYFDELRSHWRVNASFYQSENVCTHKIQDEMNRPLRASFG